MNAIFHIHCTKKSNAASTIYGKVTAISGSKVTIALGTLNQQGGNQKGSTSGSSAPQGNPPSGQSGSKSGSGSNSTAGSSNTQQDTPSSGMPGGMGDQITLTGKSKTITISNTGIITKQSSAGFGGQSSNGQNSANTTSTSGSTSASLSDIRVGSVLKITYKNSLDNLVSVEILSSMGGNSAGSSQAGGNTTEVTGTGFYTLSSGSATKSNGTITASNKDQSAVIVSNGASLKLSNMKLSTSGNSSSMDSSSFYGLNAAVLAKANSKISISNTTINTTGTGANGVFAYGNGASIDLNNVNINCKASGAHGVDATVSGVLTMNNVNITTAGNGASAAIATDRGGGTITANGGTVLTTGTKSPAIYSTGNITVNNATLKSTASEAAVIEGKNSITANNCIMTTTKNYGVFIYQSMSGDASVGSGTFTMNGGSLTAAEGPLFYSTNTTGIINLKNVSLSCKSGILLKANADQWGTTGSNGSDITLNADAQKLKGDVILDKISTGVLNLKNNSTLQGAINTDKTAKSVSLSMDKSSTWNVTADSYLTGLIDGDTTLKNIISNGYTIYYNSTGSANSWLGGKTITLTGGGKLVPMK